jgi:hypothetical protein
MKYKIAVVWTMAGTYEVEADSLEEAKEIAEGSDPPCQKLPTDGEYVDDSFEIDEDRTSELNEDEEDDPMEFQNYKD